MKTRFLCLFTAICMLLCACAEENIPSVSFESTEDDASSVDEYELLRSRVAVLLENDRKVTDIFVRGMLSGGKLTAKPQISSRLYPDFASITELMDSTYASSAISDFYLAYPISFGSSVYADENGKTTYFYRYIDEKQLDYEGFTVSGDVVTVGDIHIPLIGSGDDMRLGASLYIEAGETMKKPTSVGINTGSAAKIEGNIFVLALYFGDGGDTYPAENAAVFKKSLEEALGEIKDDAAGYGNDVRFTVREANFDHQGMLDLFESGPYELEMIFARTSLQSLDGLVKAEMGSSKYDGYLAVVVGDGENRCSGLPYTEELADCFVCERIITTGDVGSDKLKSEIMHLFGATDCDYPIVTAYQVGWKDSIAGQYINFIK